MTSGAIGRGYGLSVPIGRSAALMTVACDAALDLAASSASHHDADGSRDGCPAVHKEILGFERIEAVSERCAR